MVTDSLEAIRPKLVMLRNIEEAASAVDEMFASTMLGSGGKFLSLLLPMRFSYLC
jgi:regulator of nonsense transcripts 2